jgi:hypothetical protein
VQSLNQRADEPEALPIKAVLASRKVLDAITAMRSIARLFMTGRPDECPVSR